MPHFTASLALCDGPHSVCGVCFSLNLNQSISFLFMFYWRIIALQNFVVFCHTSTWISHQFSSVTQLGLTLCDPIDCSTPGLPVHHQLLDFTQTHVHWVCDAIQSSHPLLSPSPPAFNLSQHQGLFKWVIFKLACWLQNTWMYVGTKERFSRRWIRSTEVDSR